MLASLESWEAWETTLPAGIDYAMLNGALEAAISRLVRCPVRVFAALMDKLLGFAQTFSIKVPDPAALIEIYRARVDLPADLMALAVDRAIGEWKWGNRLPLPAELTGFAAAEMIERARDLRKIKTAQRKALSPSGLKLTTGQRSPTMGMTEAESKAYWAERLAGTT